jgi:hypothetical protein
MIKNIFDIFVDFLMFIHFHYINVPPRYNLNIVENDLKHPVMKAECLAL